MSTLFLVATPIGNLGDISERAIRTLKDVVQIAAEDTRQTRKLLSHLDIHTPMISYHEHNKLSRVGDVLDALERGDVALVSDAGTPALNDPGYELVLVALQAGHRVSPIPGPSAPLAALVASGLPTDAYLYLGYLPRRTSQRRLFLEQVCEQPYTLVFLEAPHRLVASLKDLVLTLGDRQCAIARELTKIHEEIYRCRLSDGLLHFSEREPRGEFTLVVAGSPPKIESQWSELQLLAAIRAGLLKREAPAALARTLAAESGWERREIYKKINTLRSTST